ncbi:MAG TPA: heparan-alpha-glucosaminide N-acetyltransferase domain-containing protein [Panacibacter sp.]|nr:heparan-alpha-glucosaminide N-acetyltransferase domain-containing protein [Panacibacter sp.]HNP45700.1 heparan-alpha-glucosaminide N-acetyltransferase domain-containing protein [Panacibacter sp.]
MTTQRVNSIDILRGLVMLIMALDHVRDFFHLNSVTQNPTDLASTTPMLFFTRWITHFCAPTFVLLSGVSAFIAGQRKTKKELSRFLMQRGLWLIIVEIVVMTFALSFNPFYSVIFFQILWALGFSMIMLGLLVKTSTKLILVTGLVLVFGHNIFDFIHLPDHSFGKTLVGIFLNGAQTILPVGPGRFIAIFYTALPWTGIMLLGYSLGAFYQQPNATKRRQLLFALGLCVTVLFVVLRSLNFYGDPSRWSTQKDGLFTFLSFINTTKYPPSLLFVCMTIGPALMLLSAIEKAQNKFSSILMVYGRVPFFYFVLHFYIIHLLCVIFFFATGFGVKDIVDPVIPFLFRPQKFGFDLWVVYVIWFCLIIFMYWPCRWFGKYKATHKKWWLSYV